MIRAIVASKFVIYDNFERFGLKETSVDSVFS